jgi:hypothetical protein
MTSKRDKKERKRTYEKPRLRTIELAAEEVLAIGCKILNGGFARDTTPCQGSGCVNVGS